MDNMGDIIKLQDKLTGALIGLARATEGNMHRVSESTDMVVLEALYKTAGDAGFDRDALEELHQRVEEEKRKLVPDCYYCASPCGRTVNYDMFQLWTAEEESRALRLTILYSLRSMAAYAYRAALKGCADAEVNAFFYRVLYAVGRDDWGRDELLPIVVEMGEINLRLRNIAEKKLVVEND